jgi:hypothetical protein
MDKHTSDPTDGGKDPTEPLGAREELKQFFRPRDEFEAGLLRQLQKGEVTPEGYADRRLAHQEVDTQRMRDRLEECRRALGRTMVEVASAGVDRGHPLWRHHLDLRIRKLLPLPFEEELQPEPRDTCMDAFMRAITGEISREQCEREWQEEKERRLGRELEEGWLRTTKGLTLMSWGKPCRLCGEWLPNQKGRKLLAMKGPKADFCCPDHYETWRKRQERRKGALPKGRRDHRCSECTRKGANALVKHTHRCPQCMTGHLNLCSEGSRLLRARETGETAEPLRARKRW